MIQKLLRVLGRGNEVYASLTDTCTSFKVVSEWQRSKSLKVSKLLYSSGYFFPIKTLPTIFRQASRPYCCL